MLKGGFLWIVGATLKWLVKRGDQSSGTFPIKNPGNLGKILEKRLVGNTGVGEYEPGDPSRFFTSAQFLLISPSLNRRNLNTNQREKRDA